LILAAGLDKHPANDLTFGSREPEWRRRIFGLVAGAAIALALGEWRGGYSVGVAGKGNACHRATVQCRDHCQNRYDPKRER
jgi:hypothetical protein